MFLVFLITLVVLAQSVRGADNVSEIQTHLQSYQQQVVRKILRDFPRMQIESQHNLSASTETCIPGTLVQVGGYYQGVFYKVIKKASGRV